MTDDPLCLVFIPPLVTLLYRAELEKGTPLTEEEVFAIRDNANCIVMPFSVADEAEAKRGYSDIVAEECWDEWQGIRKQFEGLAKAES